jgi:hypothetical protein
VPGRHRPLFNFKIPIPHATYQRHRRQRLHSATGYITPQDKLLGKEKAIFADRDLKLAQARHQRKLSRQTQPTHAVTPQPAFSI